MDLTLSGTANSIVPERDRVAAVIFPTREDDMKKILIVGACALALSVVSTLADAGQRHHKRHWHANSAKAAHAQWLYGGNPDAGGGPRGSVQSTNNPNASREYGGR